MNSRLSGDNPSSFERTLDLPISEHHAFFLWGPRKVGKSTLLRHLFPDARWYDLLDTELSTRLNIRPKLLREEVLADPPSVLVVDEVQKVPAILDEIHWCLENTRTRFVLCGSSARKLKRGAANLLGGRAWRYELFPLTSFEIGDYDLNRILNHGLIPSHYNAENPDRFLRAYVLDYLQEEIAAEAITRDLGRFARFLDVVGTTHGQMINYTNVARECGVSAKTVKGYFQILKDTLLGHELEAWRKRKKRRLIETAKFYMFDPGVARAVAGLPRIDPGTEAFGHAFEHFLIEEIRAYLSYQERSERLSYWRTSTGFEVDLIVGEMATAIEFKGTRNVTPKHTKGLRALREEFPEVRTLIVSLDPHPRRLEGGYDIYPWQIFCERLWRHEIL